MKRKRINGIALLAFLIVSSFGYSQTTTPSNNSRITHTPFGGNGNKYEVLNLVPTNPGVSFFSHLWWTGDNAFMFVEEPLHMHDRNHFIQQPPTVKMTDITTENYGNGGPPPLTYELTTNIGNTSPRNVLTSGNSIYMQHYRNAVIGDTMYLIVTYANTNEHVANGSLRFNVGNHAKVIDSMFTSHRHFFPNGELWVANGSEVRFQNCKPGKERSILIPVRILNNQEDFLPMRVDLSFEKLDLPSNSGQSYFEIQPSVAHSHDPNLMLGSSDAQNQCDYRNGKIHYTIKFQNTGDGPTHYVRVECFLDDKVDLSKITGITFPDFYSSYGPGQVVGSHNGGTNALYEIDRVNRKITFEMHGLTLYGTGDPNINDLELTRDQVEFDILMKSNYVFGPATVAHSDIYFDGHDPITTNEVSTICGDPLPETNGGGFQNVKPSLWDKWKWYLISGLALVVGFLGLRILKRKK